MTYKNGSVGGDITLRIHYYRPDGNYTGWEAWLWDAGNYVSTNPSGAFPFEWINGEMVCTVNLQPGTSTVGFVIRYGNWVDKDIHEIQYIDLSGIWRGTVDVYITSGWYGYDMIEFDII